MFNVTKFIDIGQLSVEMDEMLVRLMRADAALNASIPESLRAPMEHLLRNVNAYYSSKIEGNPTSPAAIIRSQEMPIVEETEHLKEIKRLQEIEARLAHGDLLHLPAQAPETVKLLHAEFYKNAPPEMLEIKDKANDRIITMIPGEFRKHLVEVGRHIAPQPEEIEGMMNRFGEFYRIGGVGGVKASQAILACAGAHHRLTYIHPFLDGNGRVTRLFTDIYMRQAGLGGVGLWSMSRGFGRDKFAYYDALARADMPRQGASDGRGILSDAGLMDFTAYFIKTAVDQVEYFSSLLNPQALTQRIDQYFDLRIREEMIIDGGYRLPKLHAGTRTVYKQLLTSKGITRADISSLVGVEERTTHEIVRQMKNAGLIKAPARLPIALDLSPSSIEILFPRLWAY